MFKDLIQLIFLHGCHSCGQPLTLQEKQVCLNCLSQLEETHFHLKPKDNPLYYRFAGKVSVEGVSSLFYFDKKGKIQKLLHALKYHDFPEVGNLMGEYWGETLRDSDFIRDIDTIIPVPLHKRKMISRGYNQSEKIAEGLQSVLKIPFSTEIIKRTRKTETQALKSRLERWTNVADAFIVENTPPKGVLIIDDVITTGSTVEACIRALMNAPSPPQIIKVGCIATKKIF
ncbi:MAG: ComF family protein [Bacteroidia bacterium]|nr:ComF family protein [Bacteroidia bacterium]